MIYILHNWSLNINLQIYILNNNNNIIDNHKTHNHNNNNNKIYTHKPTITLITLIKPKIGVSELLGCHVHKDCTFIKYLYIFVYVFV